MQKWGYLGGGLLGGVMLSIAVFFLKPCWFSCAFEKSPPPSLMATPAKTVESSQGGAIQKRLERSKAISGSFDHAQGFDVFLEEPLPTIESASGVFFPKIWTLKNGLQVAIITNQRSPVVKQMVFYKVGSMDDPPGKSGLAHFLEHLMFLGGTRFAGPKEFDQKIDRWGVQKNAYTTYDITAYYEEGPKEALEEIIKLEAGRMERLDLSPEFVLSERDVILEERNMRVDSNPGAILSEATNRVLYQNHPFGRPVLGWRHEMQGLTLEDAKDFHAHWYGPNNAVLVLAGDITEDEARPLIEKYYGALPRRTIQNRVLLKEPVDRGVEVYTKKVSHRVQQPVYERSYKTSSLSYGKATEVFPLAVAAYILNAGHTSKLYQYFIKTKKVASAASFETANDYVGPGVAGFSLLPAPGKTIGEVKAALDDFIKELLTKGLTSEEVAQAKRRLLNAFAYARDSVFAGADSVGSTLARGRSLKEIEAMPQYLESVTPEEVNAVLKNLLKRKDYVSMVLHPASGLNASSLKKEPLKGSAEPPTGLSITSQKVTHVSR